MGRKVACTMYVAGLQKNSLIDYPGKLSAVVFITGCNFGCPYCHNPELAQGRYPQKIPLDDVLYFISHRRTLLDGVVITGGEPSLWPHLYAFCRALKQLKIAVKLDTNGSRPDVLRQVIGEGLADYIAMDIKTRLDNYAPPLCDPREVPRIKESIRLIMDYAKDYEFRTTCVAPFVDAGIIQDIAEAIPNAQRYVLQSFQPKTVMDQGFFMGNSGFLTEAQIEKFQSIAQPHVSSCIIR